MKAWKQDEITRKAHDDLYEPIDPNNKESDTYLTSIINSVFTADKERTNQNAIWVQSVVEAIFDENHLSTKIDTNIVESWTGTITDESVNIKAKFV